MPTTTSRPSGIRTVVPVLLRDIAGPYLVYLILHDLAGLTNLTALVGAAVAAAALVVRSVLRSRHVDPIAAIVLVTTVAGIVVALWTGNARIVLARESVVSGALGLAFLVSLAWRPLLFSMIHALASDRGDPADAWRATPHQARSAWWISTIVCGVLLLADALLRVTFALTLPVSTAAGVTTALTLVTVVVMVGWIRWYLPRHTRMPSPPAT